MRRLVPILLIVIPSAYADEGMWTFHNFSAQLVQQKYGVQITPEWLDRVRIATVRLSGCTASFISPSGLILTNHHCVTGCLAEHSSRDKSLLEAGFLARSPEEELQCAAQIADVLVESEEITGKVVEAIAGGLFERATGREPFRIPQNWRAAKPRLDFGTRFNLSTDNDIVGGKSGSPLIDAQGRLVGLMFDGNIHSISGAYWFDVERNRAIAVHPAIMHEALSKVYEASHLLRKIQEALVLSSGQHPGAAGAARP